MIGHRPRRIAGIDATLAFVLELRHRTGRVGAGAQNAVIVARLGKGIEPGLRSIRHGGDELRLRGNKDHGECLRRIDKQSAGRAPRALRVVVENGRFTLGQNGIPVFQLKAQTKKATLIAWLFNRNSQTSPAKPVVID